MKIAKLLISVAAGTLVSLSLQAAPVPVATWNFNNTLAAQESGVPALTPINPLGLNAFVGDTVFGNPQIVYQFDGNRFPVTEQAGLSVNTTGLLTQGDAYSMDMIFKFNADSGSWKNIMDVSNRTSDNAFYISPQNQVQIWPSGNGTQLFSFGQYHRISLTNDGLHHVNAYFDGVYQFNLDTTSMDFSSYVGGNPGRIMHFFADNIGVVGQGEFASGSVAQIRLYDGELSAADVRDLPTGGTVPEPSSALLAGLAIAALGVARRRKA